MYGSGAWPTLSHQQYVHVSRLIISWQRGIVGVGFWSGQRLTDHEFLDLWQLPCLSVRLAKHRILLTLKDSWLQALRHALHWFAHMCPHDAPVESCWTARDISHWLSNKTSASINRICEVAAGYRDIYQLCKTHGVCSASLDTPQGLTAHCWQVYLQLSLERQYVFSSTCAGCGKCFWSAQRLQQHLRYSRKHEDGCLSILHRHPDPQQTSLPIHLLDIQRNPHRLPWVYAEGPSSLPATTCWVRRHQRDWDQWRVDGCVMVLLTNCPRASARRYLIACMK